MRVYVACAVLSSREGTTAGAAAAPAPSLWARDVLAFLEVPPADPALARVAEAIIRLQALTVTFTLPVAADQGRRPFDTASRTVRLLSDCDIPLDGDYYRRPMGVTWGREVHAILQQAVLHDNASAKRLGHEAM